MASDAVQILETLDNTRVTQKDYADVQWQYIFDQSQGSFLDSVQYITTILKPYFVDYHNAYIYLPIRVSSSTGVPYAGNEAIGFRDSILQLFKSMTITTDTGATIVNETMSPYFINMIRPRLENDFDFFEVNGGQLEMSREIDNWLIRQNMVASVPNNGWSKQEYLYEATFDSITNATHGTNPMWNDPNAYLLGTSGSDTIITNNNSYYNHTFANRIALFKSMTDFNGGYYDASLMIPLRYLHDFFNQLNIAVINLGFNIQLYFSVTNGQSNSTTPLFMTNDGFNGGAAPPIITLGASRSGNQSSRLYYRSVKFDAADAARMKEKLASNFTKSINFISTDYVNDRFTGSGKNIDKGTSSFFTNEITSSVVYPLRVWALAYPTPALRDPTAAGRWPLSVTPFHINNANILINNVPYYKANLLWPQDHWEQIKQQFPNGQAAIRYDQYVRFNRWMCFDLQRLGLERITSPTEPVSLAIQGDLVVPPDASSATNSNVSMIYLVERMNEITFRFSSSDVSVVVGNISLNNTA